MNIIIMMTVAAYVARDGHDMTSTMHFLCSCTGVARLGELCLRVATMLQDGHLQSLVSRKMLPAVLADAVRDHRRKMRIYQPQAIVLFE